MQRDSWLALPSVQAQFEREVDAKARELAAEAFDATAPDVREWLLDDPVAMLNVIIHAIPVSQSTQAEPRIELSDAVDRLRTCFVDDCADDYRDRARELLSEEETT